MAGMIALPRPLWVLAVVYFIASLAHFAHNAEFIAFYPGMPAGLTREHVYLVWLGITCLGVAALLLLRFGLPTLAFVLLGLYGAFGLDGLAHYALALCSEHTVWANITIWSEALSGLVLLLASSLALGHRLSAKPAQPTFYGG
ncbi:MAG TPA: hypothetical protein VLJ58_22515 [Ramlibacter sp.]|nr:hypothetical protein [Ramlibacter sp.]